MNDKLKHFIACAAISLITLTVLAVIGTDWANYEKLLAIALGVGVALLKEVVWDKWLGRGTMELADFEAGLSYVALKLFKKKTVIYADVSKQYKIGVSFRF